jgi:hypothetical protein
MKNFYKYSLSVSRHPDTMAVEYGRINFSAVVTKIIKHFFLRILGVFLILASALSAFSQEHHIYPPDASFVTTIINPNNLGEVNPGDVIFIHAGNYHQILVQNIHGAPGQPVRLINNGGVVNVGSEGSYYGISFRNCKYIEILGRGECGSNYGFVIAGIRGAGLSFGHLSSHVSASHIHIHNTSLAGIMAKSDLDCTLSSSRDNFLMKTLYFTATGCTI